MAAKPIAGYAERLLPGWGACLVGIALVAMISIAYGAAFSANLGWSLFAALAVLGAFLAYGMAPSLIVDHEGIRAGGAFLPRACIGEVQVLDREQLRIARGPGGDARNFVVLRSWAAPGGVQVRVEDPQDPHPAWLLSSRRPGALARAIESIHPAG